VQFPYTIDEKQYLYGQDLGAKKWIIQRLNDGGKMGREMQNGSWDNARQVQIPFAVGGMQYFYGQDMISRKWYIQNLNQGYMSRREIESLEITGSSLLIHNYAQ
jgi:hypothetical protein